jgi:hypothetical protein
MPLGFGVLTKYSRGDSESVCAQHGEIKYARSALWIVWHRLLVQSHCLIRTHGWLSELSPWSCQSLYMLSPWSGQSPLSAVRVRKYSHHDVVRGFSRYHPGLVRAHSQLSESTQIVAVILSEASHAIALVLSEPTGSCQRLLMLSPWSY